MPHRANATTAAATILRPCSQSPTSPLNSCTPYANRMSATAEGIVKPSHAMNPPISPARLMPTAIPNWLLAGPGRNWQRAISSAKLSSSSHLRLTTYSSRK